LNSASGRVFLAYKPWNSIRSLVESEIRSRIDRGDTSVRGIEDVKAMIAKVRSNGLGWVHSERVPGVNGLSVPIFDAFGNVVLSITVVGLSGTFDDSFSGPLANYLRELGRQVSIRLGYSESTSDLMA
jgi:DNA-binding IclR family transcriptional regulator